MKRPLEPRVRKPRGERPALGPWLILLAVAFALRAGPALLATTPRAAPIQQAPLLDGVAAHLAGGAGFSRPGPDGPVPTAALPPLAPWTLSLAYRGFGHSLRVGLLLQSLFGAMACVLVAWFGAATLGGAIGRTAGWIAAFDPLLIGGSSVLIEEALVGPLLLIALGATAAWIKTPRPSRALGVGIVWGLAILAAETLVALPLLALGWAWVPLGLTVSGGDRNRQAVLLLAGVIVVVAPWMIRNAVVLRSATPITTRAGRLLLEGNNSITWSDPERRGEGVDVSRDVGSATTPAGETAADAAAMERASHFVSEHAGQAPVALAAKIGRLWSPISESARPLSPPPAGPRVGAVFARLDLLLVWSLLLFPLALWGIARILGGARRWYQSLGLLVLAYATLAVVVFHGALRMRVPIEPLLALYAAVGFESARRRMRSRSLGLKVVEGRSKAG